MLVPEFDSEEGSDKESDHSDSYSESEEDEYEQEIEPDDEPPQSQQETERPFIVTWGGENRLTPTTINILQKEDITTEDDAVDLTEHDIERLGLSTGQRKQLYRSVVKLAGKLGKPLPGV